MAVTKCTHKAIKIATMISLFIGLSLLCSYTMYGGTFISKYNYKLAAHPNLIRTNVNKSLSTLSTQHICSKYEWKMKGVNVINCTNSNNNNLTVAITSFHKHYKTSLETLIISNHIHYVTKHNYIYFDISELLFNDSNIQNYFKNSSRNPMYLMQKVFIVHAILTDSIFGDSIDYVLWIDFDAIFYNCSMSIQHILQYTQNIYSNNSLDIIFAKDYGPNSLLNTGVVLYKNTYWTKQLLLKQTYVFRNADKFKFAHIVKSMGEVDQLLPSVLLMGYDFHTDVDNVTDTLILNIFRAALKILAKIPNVSTRIKQTNDINYSKFVHKNYISLNAQSHSAVIPQIYINMLRGQWKWTLKHVKKSNSNGLIPFIMHFNGRIGKKQSLKSTIYKHKISSKCYL
eukprot:65843_1